MMARDVYFREDILSVLRSVHTASDDMAALIDEFGGVPGDVVLKAYRRGVGKALEAVGLAFGLDAVYVGVDMAVPGGDRTVRQNIKMEGVNDR